MATYRSTSGNIGKKAWACSELEKEQSEFCMCLESCCVNTQVGEGSRSVVLTARVKNLAASHFVKGDNVNRQTDVGIKDVEDDGVWMAQLLSVEIFVASETPLSQAWPIRQ